MEPFVVLAIAAALLVVFYIVWSKRSEPTSTGPEDISRPPERDREANGSP